MNRLQKKCVIGIVGVHLLLGVILVVGPAFFYSKPKADDLQVLDVIPANLIDAGLQQRSRQCRAAATAPVTLPPPPPPTPVVTPPAPAPQKVEKTEPVKPPDKLSPENLEPVKTSKPSHAKFKSARSSWRAPRRKILQRPTIHNSGWPGRAKASFRN